MTLGWLPPPLTAGAGPTGPGAPGAGNLPHRRPVPDPPARPGSGRHRPRQARHGGRAAHPRAGNPPPGRSVQAPRRRGVRGRAPRHSSPTVTPTADQAESAPGRPRKNPSGLLRQDQDLVKEPYGCKNPQVNPDFASLNERSSGQQRTWSRP